MDCTGSNPHRMDEVKTATLKRLLEVAAIAPGNQERFLAAGLLSPQPSTGTLQLVADWQPAFQHLSVLSKETIRANPGMFLATAEDIVYRGSTSGSKGQHFVYFAGTAWNEARLQTRSRSLEWWGIDHTVPIVNVASRLFPLRLQDTTIVGSLDSAMIQRLLEQLIHQPSAIRGYPSRLCEVATLLKSKRVPSVVAVICTGECVFDFQKHLLEQVFSAPVVNEYGCQETGISGLTCPEVGRLHLDTDRCLYEVVDGQLVTTDLLNIVMPLVRYQCGDVLRLDTDPCPCGRPEPTATLLGRQEDWIWTVQGKQRSGAISMPAFDGILHYQIIRETETQMTIRVQPDETDRPMSFEAMAIWVEATFGAISVQDLLETAASDSCSFDPECDADVWIQGITRGSWAEWLRQPIPSGELHHPAQLLKALVAPEVITYGKVSAAAEQLLQKVLNQPLAQSSTVEWMTARILFFACSRLANAPETKRIYTHALKRSSQILAAYPHLSSAVVFDAFIPMLSLPTDSALSIWQDSLRKVLYKTHFQPDTFTIQHLLHAFEPAVQQANAKKIGSALPALRPLLAVLIGDLEGIADRLGGEWIAHWFELLHGRPIADDVELPKDEFLQTWLIWRQQMIRRSAYRQRTLQRLSEIARSPQEQARVLLERGYDMLMEGSSLDPTEWLPLLQSTVQSKIVTPIAWSPILRSLAKSLLKQKQHQLAYECLLAATVPSAQVSTFEQLALPCNNKQAVLVDLDT